MAERSSGHLRNAGLIPCVTVYIVFGVRHRGVRRCCSDSMEKYSVLSAGSATDIAQGLIRIRRKVFPVGGVVHIDCWVDIEQSSVEPKTVG